MSASSEGYDSALGAFHQQVLVRQAKVGTAHHQCRDKEHKEYLHGQMARKKRHTCVMGIFISRQGSQCTGMYIRLGGYHTGFRHIVSVIDLESLSGNVRTS